MRKSLLVNELEIDASLPAQTIGREPLNEGQMHDLLNLLLNPLTPPPRNLLVCRERELVIDNLLVQIHFVFEMIWWTGLAPWQFDFHFPGSLIFTFLVTS
jgi:hypothetical protein